MPLQKKYFPTKEVQERALAHVKQYFDYYNLLLQQYRRTWLSLFRAIYIFEPERQGTGKSTVFWPICFRETQKVSDRLTTNDPKFVIGLNAPINPESPDADMLKMAKANQAAMNYFWKLGNCQAKLRSWGRQGVDMGVAFARVNFKKRIHKTKKQEVVLDAQGNEKVKEVIKEEVLAEYPTFEVSDIFDTYFDPRIEYVDDYHSMIINKDAVRKSELKQLKDQYFNLDKIDENIGQAFSSTGDNYKTNKFNQEGIPTDTSYPNESLGNIKEYFGYFAEKEGDDEDEMYHITIFNDSLVIGYESINFIPFEKFVPLEIPGQGVGKGVAEPVKKLQDAYNLVRNQRIENVSLIMNKMWMMKTGAGIDTKKLVSLPGNIIPTRDMDALRIVDTPDLSQSSFAEASSLNTEIQSINSTIDTAQDSAGDNGFVNLATGQKIRWNEFNARFKRIKKNLEEALARLGEKMLMMVAERATQNPLIEDAETKKFYEVSKTAFNSFSDFYTINVLANSTAYDSLENLRDEALAKGQLAIAYKAQGVPVDMTEVFREVMDTFPGTDTDKLLAPQQEQQQQGAGRQISQAVVEQAQVQPGADEELTQQLTQVG